MIKRNIPGDDRSNTSFFYAGRHGWGWALAALLGGLVSSCAAGLPKPATIQSTALNVQGTCEQTGMTECYELGTGFERFASADPGSARQHIRNMLATNQAAQFDTLTRTLIAAAQFAGPQRRRIEQFAGFVQSIVAGSSELMADGAVAPPVPLGGTVGGTAGKNVNPHSIGAGCNYDAQCKFDRVCVDGECISSRYVETLEAQYMASVKRVFVPSETAKPESSEEFDLELLPSVAGPEVLLCTPDKVDRCMKKCEKGSADNCYAVGKLYEQLPPDGKNAEYIQFAFQKACASGLANGCVDLAGFHFYGRYTERNMPLAYQFTVKACEMGQGIGCVNAARMLKSGKGVAQDAGLADQFYVKACQLGQSDYCMAEPSSLAEMPVDGAVAAPVAAPEIQ